MKTHLLRKFSGRDLGEPNVYVGIQIELQNTGIFLHQKQYSHKGVEEFLGSFSRRTKTPLQKGADLTRRASEEEPLDNERYPYRQVVVKILYLANMTRPDIANAARELGRSCADPTMRHCRALQHVLRYLSNTEEYGIFYPRTKSELKLGREENKCVCVICHINSTCLVIQLYDLNHLIRFVLHPIIYFFGQDF